MIRSDAAAFAEWLRSAVSHELRTPLAIITGYGELLRTRDDEAIRREGPEQIVEAAQRLETGLAELLRAYAADSGGIVPDPEAIGLDEVLPRAAMPRDGWPVVLADREHLEEIVAALCAAAAARDDGGPGSIDVGCDRGFAVLSVVRRATNGHDPLGIYVARRLLELQGGSLTATNGRLSALVPLAGVGTGAPTRQIMVVDDDEAIRGMLRLTLPSEGFTLVEARDGGEALEAAAIAVPSLVVLDWKLPGCSGAEVLSQLRRRHPALPLIVLTADHDPRVYDEAVALGASAFLTKPFSPLALLGTVERLLA